MRGRRRGAPASFSDRSYDRDRSFEPGDRERDLGWSRSPIRSGGGGGVTGVNAIPLGERRKESEEGEEETKVRVWVAHSDCAKIIGKGGRTMRDVEARSRTKLKVQREDEMDASTKERYVDIVGTTSEQKAAIELLLPLATYCREDEGEVLKDSRASESGEGKSETPHVVEVLPEEVGRVLGRKGETVKVLERDSGTKIEVDKGTGRLEIFGRPEAQEKALELVLAEVSFAKNEEGTVLKDQRNRPRDQDEIELPPMKLWVKDRDAGRVIGRGGETVRDVMEKTGADIKVQKSEEMRPGEAEREIKIFGQKEQQEQALQLVLAEVGWARGEDAMLKEPPEPQEPPKPPPREERKRRRQEAKEERKEAAREREEAKASRSQREEKGGGSGAWVCGTCGGDHRTKECPHATGLLGMGMHIGMQMGMQAMGMHGLHMGMGVMGPPMMPPMMPMPGMPGMPPLGPGMLPPGSSDSSYGSSSSAGSAESRAGSVVSEAGAAPSGVGNAGGDDPQPTNEPASPAAAAGPERRGRERPRRHAGRGSRSRRRHRRRAARCAEAAPGPGADDAPQADDGDAEGAPEGEAEGEAPEEQPAGSGRRHEGRQRRRRRHHSPGHEEPPPSRRRGHASRSRDAGRRVAAAAAERGERGMPSSSGAAKKKIHLSDL